MDESHAEFWHFLIAIIFLGLSLVIAHQVTITLWKVWRTYSWPNTIGRITRSSSTIGYATSSRGGRHPFYKPQITTVYTVNGRSYRTRRLRLVEPEGVIFAVHIKRLLAQYPVGRRVTVYYDPDDPATGVLHRGMRLWIALIVIPLVIIFIVVGILAVLHTLGF